MKTMFLTVAVLYTVSTQVLCVYKDTINSYNGCQVWKNITECIDTAGAKVDLTKSEMTPVKTNCLFQTSELDSPVQIMCTIESSLYYWKIVEVTLHERIERDFGAATAVGLETGTQIGSFFGPEGTAIGAAVGGAVGLVVDIICLFVCSDPPPPNKPPLLECPVINGSLEQEPGPGKLEAVVNWTSGKATDPEDGSLSIQQFPGYINGGTFKEGTYVVNFRAADSKGIAVQCAIYFRVKVHRCNPPRWPYKGYLQCDPSYILGSKCSVSCNEGYQLSAAQQTQIHCTKTGWSSPIQDCEAKPCKASKTIKHGVLYCPGVKAVYGTACIVDCDEGFQRVGSPFMSCNKNGDWSQPPICKDTTGPIIRRGTCPNNIQVDIDSSNNTAKVDWTIPLVDDNSGEEPIIIETQGYKPGQRFAAGSYMVEYEIEDSNHNKGIPCTFAIEVQTISCQPPNLNVEGGIYMLYDCPTLYRFGSECRLSCKSGYPMVGVDKIQCLNDGSNPPNLQWEWDSNGLKPYCKVSKCPDLKPPTNGALACDLWDHGTMCQLQCQKGFDVPLIRDGMYVCGKSDGKWRPDSNVPDCNPKRNAQQMHLKSDLYYFTGTCNNSAQNLLEIKNNFVKALSTSKYHENCVGVSECKAEFVNVTCGPIATSGRRRRTDHADRDKRNTGRLAYTVTFDLTLPFKVSNTTSLDEVYIKNDDILNDMIDQIQNEVDSGHFNMPNADMIIKADSLGIGLSEYTCPRGTMPNQNTATCSGCSRGHFFSEDTGDCQVCEIGTFQDEPNQLSCKKCPVHTNTTEVATETIHGCLEYCKPGYFSINGLSPCSPCESNSYQPNNRSKTCAPCGVGKRTTANAATTLSECQDYDVRLDVNNEIRLTSSFVTPSLTISSWIILLQNKTEYFITQIKSQSDSPILSFVQRQTLIVQTESESFDTNETMQPLKWYHFAASFDIISHTLVVHINGKEVYRNNAFALSRTNIVEMNDYFLFKENLQLSSFSILNQTVSTANVVMWASTCNQVETEVIVSHDALARIQGVQSIVPSKCDAVDECEQSPCGNHTCINKRGHFECLCQEGYSGKRCEIKPNFCAGKICMHGSTCLNGESNYTCVCLYGYSGYHCEHKAVDGEYSEWSDWTQCSRSCGGGEMIRLRTCNSPEPDPEGLPCTGLSNETETCNNEKCPECKKLRRSYGTVVSCNETESMHRCQVTCRPGLFASHPILPFYECGIDTGYKWNHETDDNPRARLPACSQAKPPSYMEVSLNGQYSTVSCSKQNSDSVTHSLQNKLSLIECVKDGSCKADITPKECTEIPKMKRSTGSTLTVTVNLRSNVLTNGSQFNIADIAANKSAPSSGLVGFLKQTMILEKSAQEIFNNSVEFFQVTLNGKQESVFAGTSGVSVTPSIRCPSGTTRLNVFCADCPVGSFCDGEQVYLCPVGQYQDTFGQGTCKPCPRGKTTAGVGSVDIQECEAMPTTDGNDSEINKGNEDESTNGVKIAVGVCVSVALLTLSGAVVVFLYQYINKRKRKVSDSIKELELYPDVREMSTRPVYMKQPK